MYFLKVKGTSHIIAKKSWGLKYTSQTNLKVSSILPVFFTSVLRLSIQPFLKKHVFG
jgi:hypothetical protein